MSIKHEFGGNWTERKLEILRRYLVEYSRIFDRNTNARYFSTWYVDGFAGTGYWNPNARRQATNDRSAVTPGKAVQTSAFDNLEVEAERDSEQIKEGSAAIALEVEPGFHRYLFIEQSRTKARELEHLKERFPQKAERIRVQMSAAEESLIRWCETTDWRKNRAVVFLDPFGMQVNWSLLEKIAATRAIDLWLLFPIGVAVNRLLLKGEFPPPEWCEALTRAFGTEEWKDRFYQPSPQLSFLDEQVAEVKTADLSTIGAYFVERLETVFTAVVQKPRPLVNSRGVPLYLLCFAAGNERGARTAIKIASHLLDKF